MILQELKAYYDRKAADPESGIAPLGWEWKEIPFVIILTANGELVNVENTTEGGGEFAKRFLVPRSVQRSGSKSYERVNFLWDHRGYVLGEPSSDAKSANQYKSWRIFISEIANQLHDCTEMIAIRLFYEKIDRGDISIIDNIYFKECLKSNINPNIIFKVDNKLILEVRDILDYISINPLSIYSIKNGKFERSKPDNIGICLVSGKNGEIARTHHDTPITKDAKKWISFQTNSGYDSYGRKQAYNAPISITSEFAYTTALNILLRKGSSQKLRVGDTTTVFWADRPCKFEVDMAGFFEEPPKDNPDALTNHVAVLLESVKSGAFFVDSEPTRFFVLGLSPGGGSRISTCFWHAGTVAELARRFAEYFNDLEITHGPKDQDHLSLWRLLVSTAVQGKTENIAPNLAGNFMRAILEGRPFPETLLHAAIGRIKAEREVGYARAKLIKGCLNRKLRHHNPNQERRLEVSLNREDTTIGYRLGRLFATLEKIQEEANPHISVTIRDRFYASASSTPRAVFPNLMRLKNHHLAKLEKPGRRVNFERQIGEIVDAFQSFPPHLSLDEQGRFAIGYYHQRQDFFIAKTKTNPI